MVTYAFQRGRIVDTLTVPAEHDALGECRRRAADGHRVLWRRAGEVFWKPWVDDAAPARTFSDLLRRAA